MSIVTRSLNRFLALLATKLSTVAADGVTIIGNGTPGNPLQVAGGGASGSVSFLESPPQAWAPDSTLVFAHGQPTRPTIIQVWLLCVAANNGYAAGDRIQVGDTDSNANNRGYSCSADSTNIYIRIGTGGLGILNDTNNLVVLSGTLAANWHMYVVYPATPGAGGVTDGDKGDITVSGGGSTWTIDGNAVTYAKFQDASIGNVVLTRAANTAGDYGETALAPSQLLGRGSSGNISPISLGANLSMTGTTLNAGGGGVAWVQVSVPATIAATPGNGYVYSTGYGANAGQVTLPANPSVGDTIALAFGTPTVGEQSQIEVLLNGTKYCGFENDRLLLLSEFQGKTVQFVYSGNPSIGWISSHFVPAKFWRDFTTWWDAATLGNVGGVQGNIYNAAGNGRLIQRASGFIKSNKTYRGRQYLGVDFNATAGTAYYTPSDLAEADHTGSMLAVALFQAYASPSSPYYGGLIAKYQVSDQSWVSYLHFGAAINHRFAVSGNGTSSTLVANTNPLALNTSYLVIGYYNGSEIGSVIYGGTYDGATATVPYSGGIFNSLSPVELGAYDNANSGWLPGWVAYAGTANLTYSPAIGKELGAGVKYPWNPWE